MARQRGFAAAVRADYCHKLAARDVKAYAVQRFDFVAVRIGIDVLQIFISIKFCITTSNKMYLLNYYIIGGVLRQPFV